MHTVQAQFTDSFTYVAIVRSDKHFQGVVASIVKSRLRAADVRQESAEDDEYQRGSHNFLDQSLTTPTQTATTEVLFTKVLSKATGTNKMPTALINTTSVLIRVNKSAAIIATIVTIVIQASRSIMFMILNN